MRRAQLLCPGEPRVRRLPHLSAQDTRLALRWLALRGERADQWEWDVPLGGPEGRPWSAVAECDRMYASLLCKRVDALQRRADRWECVEIKGRGTALGLGQLLVYGHLLKLIPGFPGELVLRLVCREVDVDVLPVLKLYGVVVEEVGD